MTPGTTRVYRYDLPLARPVRVGGERLTRRRGWLLERGNADGRAAWGEAAPLPGFSRETFDEAGEALTALCGVSDPPPDAPPSVRFALHAAWQDPRLSGNRRVPLCALLTGDPARMLARAAEAADKGYPTAKLKVGGGEIEEDAALTLAVRRVLGPDVSLRLDANRAWSLEEAEFFLRSMTEEDASGARTPVVFVEEPLKDWTRLPELAARTRVPLALDETLQEVFGARTVSRAEVEPAFRAASCWVWKPTLCGPYFPQENPGLPVVFSAAYESGVGIAAIVKAAGEGVLEPLGIDTYTALAEDVLARRLPLDGPEAERREVFAAAEEVDRSRLELVYEHP